MNIFSFARFRNSTLLRRFASLSGLYFSFEFKLIHRLFENDPRNLIYIGNAKNVYNAIFPQIPSNKNTP